MKQLLAAVEITRPLNVFITGLVVFCLAYMLQNQSGFSLTIVTAAIAAALTAAAGNVINDLIDIETDRKNHPARVLPSGRMSVTEARRFFAILVILSMLIVPTEPFALICIVAAVHLSLFLYAVYVQFIPFIGNFTVALMTGTAFIYAGIAAYNVKMSIIPALFGFLVNLNRELVKDLQDMNGDATLGKVSVPLRYGVNPTKKIIVVSTMILIGATWLPMALFSDGIYFSAAANLFVNPVLIFAMKKLLVANDHEQYAQVSFWYKISMLAGLGAMGLWL